jgi:hypothetical protein
MTTHPRHAAKISIIMGRVMHWLANTTLKLRVFCLIFGLTSCAGIRLNPLLQSPKAPVAETKESCDLQGHKKDVNVKDWSGRRLEIHWTEHATRGCPGPDFPRIKVRDSRVSAFVHFVEVQNPPRMPSTSTRKWGEKLDAGFRGRWLFLDVDPQARERQWPFYNTEFPSSYFHDNPLWQPLEATSQSRSWRGRLYGIQFHAEGGCQALWGVEWGFNQLPGKAIPVAIKPVRLDKAAWFQDEARLKKLEKDYCLRRSF